MTTVIIFMGFILSLTANPAGILSLQETDSPQQAQALSEILQAYPAGYYEYIAHVDIASLQPVLKEDAFMRMLTPQDSWHLTSWVLKFLPDSISDSVESITLATKVKVRPFKVQRNKEGKVEINDPLYERMTKGKIVVGMSLTDIDDVEYAFVNAGDPLIVVYTNNAEAAVKKALKDEELSLTGEKVGNLAVLVRNDTKGGVTFRLLATPDNYLFIAETNELLAGMYDAWTGAVQSIISEYEFASLPDLDSELGQAWNMRVIPGIRKAIVRKKADLGIAASEIATEEEKIKQGQYFTLSSFKFSKEITYKRFEAYGNENSASDSYISNSAHPEQFLGFLSPFKSEAVTEDYDDLIAAAKKSFKSNRNEDIVSTVVVLGDNEIGILNKIAKTLETNEKENTESNK